MIFFASFRMPNDCTKADSEYLYESLPCHWSCCRLLQTVSQSFWSQCKYNPIKQHHHLSSKVSKNLDKHIKQYFMDDFAICENTSDVPTVTTIPISQLNYILLSGNKDFVKIMAYFSKPFMFIQLERRNI